jgi:DNA (cytosine-5)-methyltransferase 1
VEWELPAIKTLSKRLSDKWHFQNADKIAVRFDMRRSEELFRGWSNDPEYGSHPGLDSLVNKKKVDLVIGGPPCQAYSLAGRIRDEHGMRNDYRNFLFEAYAEVIKKYQPKAFIFENVPGLLSAKPTGVPIQDLIRKAFSDLGYEIIADLHDAQVNMADYGLPQNRKRLIILGVSKKYFKDSFLFIINDFYHNILPTFKTEKRTTVEEAIGSLPKFFPLSVPTRENGRNISHKGDNNSVPNHEPRFHSVRDIGIFRMLAEDIKTGKNKFISADALKKLYTQKTGKTSSVHKYHVLRSDEPSCLIPAHLFKDGLRHIHPDPNQARSITVREAARLQGFDDDFIFYGSMGDQYKMIGNAVPPMFAKIIAASLYKILNRYDPDFINTNKKSKL